MKFPSTACTIVFVTFLAALWAPTLFAQTPLDLRQSVVVLPSTLTGPPQKAAQMLVEEIEKRSRIRLKLQSQKPAAGVPSIVLAKAGTPVQTADGYSIATSGNQITITGNDDRGVVFGAGRLLRALALRRDSISLDQPLNLSSAPKYPLRGHQLGYRPKTNSYDAWTVAMWEQYIRDLVVFGTNAIELIPPRSDDDADSPHFPLPPMEMMVEMSRICSEYGVDVWIWYPALDKDYSDPATVDFAIREWAEVFRRLPRIDHILVPGGDPGSTPPRYLLPLLEKQSANLKRFHPRAGMWVAPQGFSREWMDEFLGMVSASPKWLTGIVYGPQCRLSLPDLRKAIPKGIPIRHYPDITHSRHSQFAVPDWDYAFALTEAREVINPRPQQMATIFRAYQPLTVGAITYSEGCNDDVNKFIWSELGWDPETDVRSILREYSRYFIGAAYEDSFTAGLMALERNWTGPAVANKGIADTLRQFKDLEAAAEPSVLLNWRFQQALYRAYYDEYVRRRVINETSLEEQAMEKLAQARRKGTFVAMSEAEEILDRAVTQPVAQDIRARIFELGEALFQSIRMQLSVEKYKAIAVGRGANLNTIDFPLNDRLWLKDQFKELRQPMAETARQKRLEEILHRQDPGPGGFYDDLGDLTRQPHLVRGPGLEQDPPMLRSSVVSIVNSSDGALASRSDFALTGMGLQPIGPVSWWTLAETYYDTPLRMHYEGLDRSAAYKLRVVYTGDPQRSVRLVANEEGAGIEIHGLIKKEYRPLEFDIPGSATARGSLDLSWYQDKDSRGAGRGCQVAEVWLIRK